MGRQTPSIAFWGFHKFFIFGDGFCPLLRDRGRRGDVGPHSKWIRKLTIRRQNGPLSIDGIKREFSAPVENAVFFFGHRNDLSASCTFASYFTFENFNLTIESTSNCLHDLRTDRQLLNQRNLKAYFRHKFRHPVNKMEKERIA